MLVKTDGKLGGKPGGIRKEKRKDKCFVQEYERRNKN